MSLLSKKYKPKNAEEKIWDDFLDRRAKCCGMDCCQGVLNGLVDETTGTQKQLFVDNNVVTLRDQP